MSDLNRHNPEDGGEHLAAEYVLGLLDPEMHRIAEHRIEIDPQFAADVAFWQNRLMPLADGAEPVEPPNDVWLRVAGFVAERRHGAQPSEGRSRIPEQGRATRLWNDVAFWRPLAFGAILLALASFGWVTHLKSSRPSPTPPLVARLAPASGAASFIVAADADRATAIVVPATSAEAARRTLELWMMPPDGTPRSLGLVEATRPVNVLIPQALLPQLGESALAISVEPAGGSPTGRPTGPVIAQGKFSSF